MTNINFAQWKATQQIDIKRGLKQGDPLASFLFLVVAEGLADLFLKATELGVFKGFKISLQINFSLLQYSLIFSDPFYENLWALKAIFISFEMMASLPVNFHKSNICRVNIDIPFLRVAKDFLHCNLVVLPFKFLGLPIGRNPRRCNNWEPMVEIRDGNESSNCQGHLARPI